MSRPQVYVTRKMNDDVMKLLSETCDVTVWEGEDPVPREELCKNIRNADGVFCGLTERVDEEVLKQAEKLKVISTMSAGYDHLDLEALKKRGIRVGYTPETLTDATAELTVSLLLATSRRLFEAESEARNGGWKAWSPFWMCGPGLAGSTVGIVGFGRIAQEVAKRLKPFKPREMLYFSRSVRKEAQEIGATKVEFEELVQRCDFIICCCALTPGTQGLFDAKAFQKMKSTAIFINTSRGAVVDQDALVHALETGQIGAAGLDVMTPEPLPVDHRLFQLRNCVILPHIGSACTETRNDMALLTANNILAVLHGKPMPSELQL